MITRDEIDRFCAALPGAALAHPPELVSWKVGGKMFACFGGDRDMEGVSVKTSSTDTAEMLIETSAAIKAPYFHRSWVRLPFSDIDTEEAHHCLQSSYELILKSLPKKNRKAIAAGEDGA